MLVQVDEDLWIDPMEVITVFPYTGNREWLKTSLGIRVVPTGEPVHTRWPIEKVLEQLNGRTK